MVRGHLFWILSYLAFSVACTGQPLTPRVKVEEAGGSARSLESTEGKDPMRWPKDWSLHLGNLVSIEGMAIDQKIGATLTGEGETIFIDGIDAWPAGFYLGGDRGKRVRVTGVVIERHDLPVVISKIGDPPRAGLAVPEGTDLHKASRRYLIRNAIWVLVE